MARQNAHAPYDSELGGRDYATNYHEASSGMGGRKTELLQVEENTDMRALSWTPPSGGLTGHKTASISARPQHLVACDGVT